MFWCTVGSRGIQTFLGLLLVALSVEIRPAKAQDAPLGTPCSSDSECSSTFCRNGVCCNEDCDGTGFCNFRPGRCVPLFCLCSPILCQFDTPIDQECCRRCCASGHLECDVQVCPGDCYGVRKVTIQELVLAIGIALDESELYRCFAADPDESNVVTVDELLAAVNSALYGCPDALQDHSCPN